VKGLPVAAGMASERELGNSGAIFDAPELLAEEGWSAIHNLYRFYAVEVPKVTKHFQC
jgi:hypothetical protein